MPNISKINVKKISKLANLPLTESEENLFAGQLTQIISYVEKVENAETKDTEPTFNVSQNLNDLRQDTPVSSLSQTSALKNAKKISEGFITTKGVFENE